MMGRVKKTGEMPETTHFTTYACTFSVTPSQRYILPVVETRWGLKIRRTQAAHGRVMQVIRF
jgi:hypothetical protein